MAQRGESKAADALADRDGLEDLVEYQAGGHGAAGLEKRAHLPGAAVEAGVEAGVGDGDTGQLAQAAGELVLVVVEAPLLAPSRTSTMMPTASPLNMSGTLRQVFSPQPSMSRRDLGIEAGVGDALLDDRAPAFEDDGGHRDTH